MKIMLAVKDLLDRKTEEKNMHTVVVFYILRSNFPDNSTLGILDLQDVI